MTKKMLTPEHALWAALSRTLVALLQLIISSPQAAMTGFLLPGAAMTKALRARVRGFLLMQPLLAKAAAANKVLITRNQCVCSSVNDAEWPVAGLHFSSLCGHP